MYVLLQLKIYSGMPLHVLFLDEYCYQTFISFLEDQNIMPTIDIQNGTLEDLPVQSTETSEVETTLESSGNDADKTKRQQLICPECIEFFRPESRLVQCPKCSYKLHVRCAAKLDVSLRLFYQCFFKVDSCLQLMPNRLGKCPTCCEKLPWVSFVESAIVFEGGEPSESVVTSPNGQYSSSSSSGSSNKTDVVLISTSDEVD